jgi:hypothetical protein
MAGDKEFDCVAIKDAAQRRRRAQYEGLSDEEIRRRMHETLAASPDPAARKWREIEASRRAAKEGSQSDQAGVARTR